MNVIISFGKKTHELQIKPDYFAVLLPIYKVLNKARIKEPKSIVIFQLGRDIFDLIVTNKLMPKPTLIVQRHISHFGASWDRNLIHRRWHNVQFERNLIQTPPRSLAPRLITVKVPMFSFENGVHS